MTDSIVDGPAFPSDAVQPGLTVRQYYVAEAMKGVIGMHDMADAELLEPSGVAKLAIQIAEATLDELNRVEAAEQLLKKAG